MHETPLHLAVMSCCAADGVCCIESVRLLLEAGAHPDCLTIAGRSPLDLLACDACICASLFPKVRRLTCLAAAAVSRRHASVLFNPPTPLSLHDQVISSLIKLH